MPDVTSAPPELVEDHPTSERTDGGEALLEAFRALEIEHVFCASGSEWAPAWEAFARQRRDGTPGPRYHDLTHETLAVAMATGYWLGSKRLAAVLLHTVPGLLQGGNAIHGALLAGAPMLVASSESITYGEGTGPDPGGQWYRNLSFVGGPHVVATPFTKWAGQVADVTDALRVGRAGDRTGATESSGTGLSERCPGGAAGAMGGAQGAQESRAQRGATEPILRRSMQSPPSSRQRRIRSSSPRRRAAIPRRSGPSSISPTCWGSR